MGLLSFAPQQRQDLDPITGRSRQLPVPPQSGGRLGLLGATLQDVAAGLNGQVGGSVQRQQAGMIAQQQTAAQQAQLRQIEASITDPNELALFRANPEAWSKARASQYETVNVGGGDSRFIPGQGFKTAPKLVADNGVYGTQTADGYTGTGARTASIAEAETARQNDPNTLGGLSWGRVQDNGLGRDRLALDTTKAAQDYRLGVGQLGVSQGQLGLGRQRLALDQGSQGASAGYAWNADHTAQHYIPGGSADPNTAKRAAPTEDQAKTEFNLGRMRNASKAIDPLEAAGFDRGASLTPGVINPKRRSYDNAKAEWLDALIRQTTGAAATKQEIAEADKAYFPQFGDPPNEIARKAQARTAAQTGSATRAGPAEKPASNGWSIVR